MVKTIATYSHYYNDFQLALEPEIYFCIVVAPSDPIFNRSMPN